MGNSESMRTVIIMVDDYEHEGDFDAAYRILRKLGLKKPYFAEDDVDCFSEVRVVIPNDQALINRLKRMLDIAGYTVAIE